MVSVMPHRQIILKPWRSNPRISTSEGAAPPTNMRTGQENFHRPGLFSSASRTPNQTVGTPSATVTRSCSIRSRIPSGSAKGPGRTTFDPANAEVNGIPQPFA